MRPTAAPRPLVLVVCEGKNSEPSYLRAFAREWGVGVVHVEIIGGLGAPLTLVAEAKARKSAHAKTTRKNSFAKNDSFWVVFDCDEHPSIDEARANARAAGISVAYSNPCFEVWLLIHVEGVTVDAPLGRNEAQHELQQKVTSYQAAGGKTVDFDEIKDGYERACAAAEKMRKRRDEEGDPLGNPYTDFDELTELIRTGP